MEWADLGWACDLGSAPIVRFMIIAIKIDRFRSFLFVMAVLTVRIPRFPDEIAPRILESRPRFLRLTLFIENRSEFEEIGVFDFFFLSTSAVKIRLID